MKKLVVLSAVLLLLLALAQVGQAATLQAGWYADFYVVYVYVPSQYGPSLLCAAQFATPPGTYGPFQLTDGPYHQDTRRIASVPIEVNNASPDQSLELPIDLILCQGASLAYLSVGWQTNYDPSQMYIDLWQRHSDGTTEQVWSQMNGGLHAGTDHILYDTVVDGSYYFKVNIVPEPSSFLPLLFGVVGLVSFGKRRR